MFVEAREATTAGGNGPIEADVCIVGAGAAGIAIARELSRAGVSTIVLESGGMAFEDGPQQDAYRGDVSGGLPYFALDMCQLRFFGGNTNAWGGWCRPLDAADFERRPWVAESGWPISASELASWYETAQTLCEVTPELAGYAPDAWAALLGDPLAAPLPVDPAKLETKIYRFSPPTNFAARYGDEIRDATSVRCILHANVVGIDAAPDGASVRAVRFAAAPGGGSIGTVAAKLFILAVGGVENARLLLASNDVAERGLGNAHDLVGRYFMEQPHTRRLLFARRRADVPFRLYGERFRARGVAARLALTPQLQEREELLNFGANISPIHAGHDSKGWTALRALVFSLRDGRPSDPFLRFPPFDRKGLHWRDVGRLIADLPGVATGALSAIRHGEESIAAYVLENKSEQAPNFHSRVTLDPAARDAFGVPRAKLEWRTQDIDRRTTRRAEQVIEGELQRLGLADLAPPSPDMWDGWPDSLKGGWAQIGTTRMHDDPRKGVVDRHCRVHGVGNLFVAGSSVFPTSGSAPPMLTVLALSLRLAAHVKAQLATPLFVSEAAE